MVSAVSPVAIIASKRSTDYAHVSDDQFAAEDFGVVDGRREVRLFGDSQICHLKRAEPVDLRSGHEEHIAPGLKAEPRARCCATVACPRPSRHFSLFESSVG